MFCGQCGNEVKDEAKFCGMCGASLNLPIQKTKQIGFTNAYNGAIINQPNTLRGVLKKQCNDYVFLIATIIFTVAQVILTVSITKMIIELILSSELKEMFEMIEELDAIFDIELPFSLILMLTSGIMLYISMIAVVISGIRLSISMFTIFLDAGAYGESIRTRGFYQMSNALRSMGSSVVVVVVSAITVVLSVVFLIFEIYNIDLNDWDEMYDMFKLIVYIVVYFSLAISFYLLMSRNARRVHLYLNIAEDEKHTCYIKDYSLAMLDIVGGIIIIVAIIYFAYMAENESILSELSAEISKINIFAYIMSGIALMVFGFKIYATDNEMEMIVAKQRL